MNETQLSAITSVVKKSKSEAKLDSFNNFGHVTVESAIGWKEFVSKSLKSDIRNVLGRSCWKYSEKASTAKCFEALINSFQSMDIVIWEDKIWKYSISRHDSVFSEEVFDYTDWGIRPQMWLFSNSGLWKSLDEFDKILELNNTETCFALFIIPCVWSKIVNAEKSNFKSLLACFAACSKDGCDLGDLSLRFFPALKDGDFYKGYSSIAASLSFLNLSWVKFSVLPIFRQERKRISRRFDCKIPIVQAVSLGDYNVSNDCYWRKSGKSGFKPAFFKGKASNATNNGK